ncbi:hypothetical protein O0L34_g18525 [Tuta absoluta]|nr:hypothetical protein O0L34_g18525 [Tuta absoluta]
MASLTKDEILILLRPPFTNWSNIIREAEKVVGYPTSFMNLRCLLSDEFANMALYLRKLVGSNHLVMQTAKNILYGDSKNLQPWGLIILLLSKSVRSSSPPQQLKKVEEHQRQLAELTEMIRTGHLIHKGRTYWERDILVARSSSAPQQLKKVEEHQRQLAELTEMIRTGHLIHKGRTYWERDILVARSSSAPQQLKKVEEHQRQLAELTEMIRTGHLIHKGIVNVPFAKRNKDTESAIFGNKIAILLGDYLLVTANGMLANLRNSDVSYIISTALKDLSEGEFFGERDEQNQPLPGKPSKAQTDLDITFDTKSIKLDVLGKPRKEWTARSIFNGVSLLGRGCQSAMVLAKQSRETQNFAYHFGCHVGLAWQAAAELQKLTSESKEQFCLASAPVLFALEGNPDLYKIIDQAKNDVNDIDYEDLKFNILKTDAVDKTKMLYEEHAKKATAYAENIGQNESLDMIKKLINTY